MTAMIASSLNDNSNKSIERYVLLPVGNSHKQLRNPANRFTDLSALTPKPHVGLLFVAPGMYWGRKENHKLEQEVAAAYGWYFGGKVIAVGCNQCLTEGPGSLRSCAGPRGQATGTPGLLFWPSDGLRVRVSHDDVGLHWCTSGVNRYLVPSHVENLVDELGLDDREDSALLVFANSFPPFIPAIACLFNALQKKCKSQRTSLWGGYFNDDVSVAEIVGTAACLTKQATIVLLRLTGPRLDSASTIVKCNRSRLDVDAQLRQFKTRLKLRRRSVLLMSGPVEINAGGDGYRNCKEFKAAAMKIFDKREIQILGAFGNMPHAIGVDSSIHESNEEQRYLWHNCMSLMILTYD